MTTTVDDRPARSEPVPLGGIPWPFLAIAFAFTWLVCLPGVLAARGLISLPVPSLAIVALAQFGPTLSAFLLVYRRHGKAGVARLGRRALNLRIPWRWLLVTLLLPPTLSALALRLHVATGGSVPTLDLISQPAAILPTFLFIS